MSDSKKNPSPLSDDFSKTTPNIPRADDVESSDWEKTNYNTPKFAPQPPADDWGKTVANIPPIKDEPDFNKTYMPANNPKSPDWGVTDSNIKLPDHDFGGEKMGSQTNYGATSPFINLPEAERAKYQNLPPTPTQAAEQKKQEEQKKGGIPGWFWAVGGLLSMFFFAIIVLLLVYFFFLRPTGFEVVIQSAPARSEVWIDNTRWGITDGDGTIRLQGLRANEIKKIEIKHPDFTCEPRELKGTEGGSETITARCTKTGGATTQTSPTPNNDCQNFKVGEFDKAQRCANQALDNLKEPYSAEDVTRALNMYIINFDVNKYDIKPNDMVFLEKASNYIKKLPPTTVIEIGGHTDSDGTDQKNQVLSENRAKSVRDAFVTKFGVNPNMLVEKGYGESRPRPGNQNRNPDEKFQNRRIEYTVMKK